MRQVFPKIHWISFLHKQLVCQRLDVIFVMYLMLTYTVQALEPNIATTGMGALNTNISQNGSIYEISGGEQHGRNLFHSFERFNLGAGNTAKFLNNSNANISNILSRVTGGGVSKIDGTIDTMNFPNANFFFLNPAGVEFGTEARLNVGGSFYVSTADYLKLKDSTRFYADPVKQTSLLTVADPSAFGFLETVNGKIMGSGHLKVSEGKSITFTASGQDSTNVRFEQGILDALGGDITLKQVSPSSEVSVKESSAKVSSIKLANLIVPEKPVNQEILIRGGNLTVSGGAVIGKSVIKEISVNVEKLVLEEGGSITTKTFFGNSGEIKVDAETMELSNAGNINTEVLFGNSGDITINVDNLVLQDGGRLDSSALVSGIAGKIDIQAADSAMISNDANSNVSSGIFANGANGAGNIHVTSPVLVVDGASSFESTTIGGIGGEIIFNVDSLALTGGAKIQTSAFVFSENDAGAVKIDAKESVSVSAEAQISSSTTGAANAGNIIIESPNLNVTNKGLITTLSNGSGNAGQIDLTVSNLSVSNGGKIDSTANGLGDGGNINVFNAETLNLDQSGQITTNTAKLGKGGSINISTKQFSITNNSSISSSSESTELNINELPDQGKSGDIFISASDYLQIQAHSNINVSANEANAGSINLTVGNILNIKETSEVRSSVLKETGDGGNIFIDPIFVIVDENSKIEADVAEGNGGQINIVTDFFLGFRNNVTANANGPGGLDGTVNINAPDANIDSKILLLPESFIDVISLLSVPCTAQSSVVSSLTIGNSSGTPISFGSLMAGNIMDLENDSFGSNKRKSGSSIYKEEADSILNVISNYKNRKPCFY